MEATGAVTLRLSEVPTLCKVHHHSALSVGSSDDARVGHDSTGMGHTRWNENVGAREIEPVSCAAGSIRTDAGDHDNDGAQQNADIHPE
jgi:hypothetical protein